MLPGTSTTRNAQGAKEAKLHTPDTRQTSKKTACAVHTPSCMPAQHSKAVFQPDWQLRGAIHQNTAHRPAQ
jgi:hypothetical protein